MKYVKHSLIKHEAMESRDYQESIFKTAKEKNTIVCLPTGLGKTPIAVMLTAERLKQFPNSRVLICSPTKPLTEQHAKSFLKFLVVDEKLFHVVTGTISPNKRKNLYKEKRIIFATPQTIRNDIDNGIISLKDFSLLILDEIHHSIGEYSYNYIAKAYLETADNPRVLGLTASPGATKEKINEICKNTGIETVEIRTEKDEDVSPYINKKDIEWIEVELPESFLKIREYLKALYERKIKSLKKWRQTNRKITKRYLLEIQKTLIRKPRKDSNTFIIMALISQAIKLEHAIGLLETQGISNLIVYLDKMKREGSKSVQRMMKNKFFTNAEYLLRELNEQGAKHPKIAKICQLVSNELSINPESRIIVFANYRETVKQIKKSLETVAGAKPVILIGQKEGLSQKEQVDIIRKFSDGIYNIMITTSIGEEGLDIAGANIAIFYDSVPSEIRSIQRRGRVGRAGIGRVIMLIAKGTRDEAYRWSAYHKEMRMKNILHEMKEQTNLNHQ